MAGSVANALAAIAIFAVLWIITLPLWLTGLGYLLLAPAALIYLPYRAVQHEMGLRRTLENWVVTPGSFVAAPTHVQSFLLSLLPGPRILA